jgi:5-methylcytosine-specific restriction endonuclease McrA
MRGRRSSLRSPPPAPVIFDEARRQGLRERPEAYEADALVALLTGARHRRRRVGGSGTTKSGSGTRNSGTRSTSTGTRSTGETGSDGDDIDDSDFDHSEPATNDSRSTCFPPPASVHLRVDLAALRRGHLDNGECCEIPGIGPVPLETARSVLGDAILHLVITKGSDVATISSLGRTIRAPLRTALIERDQCCVVPGCDVREGLEIDHRIIPVVENGEAALWNLARLCHRHHYLRTHKGFRLEGGPGAWQWLPPERPPPSDLDHPEDSDDDDRPFKLE